MRRHKPHCSPAPWLPSVKVGNKPLPGLMDAGKLRLVKMLKIFSFGKSFRVHHVLIIYFSKVRRDLLHTPPPGKAEKSDVSNK